MRTIGFVIGLLGAATLAVAADSVQTGLPSSTLTHGVRRIDHRQAGADDHQKELDAGLHAVPHAGGSAPDRWPFRPSC